MMGIQENIKTELLQQVNSDIDQHYDFLEQRFQFTDEQINTLVRELNRLKEEIYELVTESQLS